MNGIKLFLNRIRYLQAVLYLPGLLFAFGCAGRPPDPGRAYLDIRIDGIFGDWESVEPVYTAPEGSPGPAREVRMADTPELLFVRFDLAEETILQSDNHLVFHLDADNDPATGLSLAGIGADFTWRFGEREGTVRAGGREEPVNAYQAGVVTAPTVSSERFEFKLDKTFFSEEETAFFSSTGIAWVLAEDPDGGAGEGAASGTYRLRNIPRAPYPEIPIGRPEGRHIRLVSFNVLWDGHLLRPDPFRRILRALNPDVIAFQEIGRKTSEKETRGQVEKWLGGEWYSGRRRDCVTVSRYPIVGAAAVDGNLAVLIDLPEEDFDRNILVINTHLPFGPRHEARAAEISNLLSFIETAGRGEGPIPIEEGTPVVLIGDKNLVGPRVHLKTLLKGEERKPDWDSTPLADLHPYHSSAPRSYTWRSYRRAGFGPGRLDYVIYTDSVLEPIGGFILATDSMSEAALERHGLRRDDTDVASDHYPLVVDFRLKMR